MTIKEVANITGVTPSLLSQIERGLSNPSINTLKLISKALDVPLFYFLRKIKIVKS
ncbi:helix-turn-helix family protein [[Clostridium] sordellii ATCC 9714]|nr:helix-turn-helix family protein [[Clostridium] sordellii ATCC 9714] [Paeniclostridium sordellii ATCC 9714]